MKRHQWNELETFLLSERNLATSTTHKTLRKLRALERAGLDLQRPARHHYNGFLAKRKRDGRDGPGDRHYGRAVNHLLAWRGISWPGFRLPPTVQTTERELLPDAIVARLLEYDQGRDELETQAARFAMRFGFYVTRRPPSEHVAVDVQDFDREHRTLRVWSDKLDTWRRKKLEPWLADEISAYIDGFRAQVAKRSETALLVDPYTGRAWTSAPAYGMWLGRCGRRVYPRFRPYDLRHAGATWRLIQWNFNIVRLRNWLDHKSVKSTETYEHLADEIVERRATAEAQPYELGALA